MEENFQSHYSMLRNYAVHARFPSGTEHSVHKMQTEISEVLSKSSRIKCAFRIEIDPSLWSILISFMTDDSKNSDRQPRFMGAYRRRDITNISTSFMIHIHGQIEMSPP
jgi:hypothetical protein